MDAVWSRNERNNRSPPCGWGQQHLEEAQPSEPYEPLEPGVAFRPTPGPRFAAVSSAHESLRHEEATVVVVTHVPLQARRIAGRTGLMISGRMVETADTEAFFTNPQRPETIAFLRGDLVY